MSYRELYMLDVKEVLRRWQAGQSARAIARAGVGDRKTVGRYIDAAKLVGVGLDDALSDNVFDARENQSGAAREKQSTSAGGALCAPGGTIGGWRRSVRVRTAATGSASILA